MPQTQQPSTHAAPPQAAVLDDVSQAVASDRRCRPHPTHGRYLGVRSAVAPPTATAFQSRPVYQPHPYHPSITDETGLFSKDTQCMIDRFVADIGGQDLFRRFKGFVNHKRSPPWIGLTTPSSSPNTSGLDFQADRHGHFQLTNQSLETTFHACQNVRTPVRVAVHLRLFPDHFLTKKAHKQNAVVAVPTIDMSQVLRRAARSPSRTPTRNPRQRL